MIGLNKFTYIDCSGDIFLLILLDRGFVIEKVSQGLDCLVDFYKVFL